MSFWKKLLGAKESQATDVGKKSSTSMVPQPNAETGVRAGPDAKAVRDKALHSAAFKGDTKAGATLLAEGANVNAKDDQGRTPLRTAAWQGHREMVAFLIEHGAEVNSHPDDGPWETPLHEAAGNNHREVVELLLAKGADVNAADSLGRTPLYKAIEYDYTSVAAALIQSGAAVDGIPKHDDTPLTVAIMAGHKDSVQLLAENGADVNAKGGGIAPLTSAVFRQDAKLVEILLRYGDDVNTRTHKGESALVFAVRQGCAEVVALLINPPTRASIAETLSAHVAKPVGTAPPLNVGTDGVERRANFPKRHYENHLDGWKTLLPKVETALQNSPAQNQESATTSLVNAIALDIQAHSEVSVHRIAYLQMGTMTPTFKNTAEGKSSFFLFSIERDKHLANSYYWYSRLLREWPNTKLLAVANGDMGILSFMDLMHSVWKVKYDQALGTEPQLDGILEYYWKLSVGAYDDGGKLTDADALLCKKASGAALERNVRGWQPVRSFLAANVIRHMDLALAAKERGDEVLVPIWENVKEQASKLLH